MKICVVSTWPPHRDGIAYYSENLYGEVSKTAQVTVLSNVSNINQNNKNLSVWKTWERNEWLYPLRIFRAITKNKPDVVHFQHGWLLYGDYLKSSLFLILFFLLRLRRIPLVTTVHTVIKRDKRLFRDRLVNLIAVHFISAVSLLMVRLSNRVILHNPLMKKVLTEHYGVKQGGKMVVIPHGVKRALKKGAVGGGSFKILSLGFLREAKSLDQLIEAFHSLRSKHGDVSLTITGGKHAHDSRAEFVRFLHRIESENNGVTVTRFLNEETLEELIAGSSVISLLSSDDRFVESSGTLGLIADYGKAILCSDITKFNVDLKNNVNSILVKPDNLEEASRALFRLYEDAGFRMRIAGELKKIAKGRYWDIVAGRHVDVYKKAIKDACS